MKKNLLILGGVAFVVIVTVVASFNIGPSSTASLHQVFNGTSPAVQENKIKSTNFKLKNIPLPGQGVVKINLSPSISSKNLNPGALSAEIFKFSVVNGTASDVKLMQFWLHGYVDCDTSGIFSHTFNATIANNCPNEIANTSITSLVDNLQIYSDNTFISQGQLLGNESIFGALMVTIPAGTIKEFSIRGDINQDAPYGTFNDRFKFGFEGKEKVMVVDAATNAPLNSDLIELNDNPGGPTNDEILDSGVIMTVGL